MLEQAYHSVASVLATQCNDCLHQLRVWKHEWEMLSDVVDFFKTSSASLAGPGYPHALFGSPLTFLNLRQANHYVMYNAIRCTFLSIAYELSYEASLLSTDVQSNAINESLFFRPGRETPCTDHDHLLEERRNCAIEICRSAPYHHLTEQHGCSGVYIIMFPLLAARQVFMPGEGESSYIDSVLPCFAENMGFKSLTEISPGMRVVSLATLRADQALLTSQSPRMRIAMADRG